MEETVKERLIKFLKYKAISQKTFASTVGLSPAYVNSIKVSIQPKTLQRIASVYPDLNIGWLATGEGTMLRGSIITPTGETGDIPVLIKGEAFTDKYGVRWIPLLPVYAHGGSLTNFAESVTIYDCDMIVSPVKDADFAITVVGESMAPEFPSGCQILIKKYDGSLFIDWGRTYVLDTINGAIIKRLVPSNNPDYVHCVSINPDPMYAPFDVPKDCIIGMYSVVMMIARK